MALSSEIKVGSLFFIGLGLAVWFTFQTSKGGGGTGELKVDFRRVARLAPGDPVLYNGVKVGKIASVLPVLEGEGDPRIQVAFSVDEKAKPAVLVGKDSLVRINQGLLGGASMEIMSDGGELINATNVAKLVILIILAWSLISWRLPSEVVVTTALEARLADDAMAMWKLSMLLAAAMLVIGMADLIYQRWQHTRDNMMTKQEMKEEFKQMEGNQEVKGRMRQLARQMAQRRMMQEVPKADVIITNPTHVAVALKYEQGRMDAPVCLAKGYDEVAQKIKAIAAEHGIPMVENIELARALAREVQIGQAIKAKWFKPVAEILAAVYRLRKGAAA